MKKRFVKLRVFSGALMMIIVLIYGIIFGQKLDEKYILLSLVIGLLAGWLIGFLRKRINSYMISRINVLEMSLNDGEKIIVEGIAKNISKESDVEGKLFLTDDRLIFLFPVSMYQIDYPLNEIKGIYLNKTWGVFNKGFTIAIKGKEEKFTLEYPGDWKKIITKQQEMNRDLENAVL